MPKYQFPEGIANSKLYHGYVYLEVSGGYVEIDNPTPEQLAAIAAYGGLKVLEVKIKPEPEAPTKAAKRPKAETTKDSEVITDDSTDA